MTNVYEGPPDGRQSVDPGLTTSRFRPRYRALSEIELALHDTIKRQADFLLDAFYQVEIVRRMGDHEDRPREAALALTKLEEAVMWAIKGLTA